jgi:hypothetical protein
MENFNFDINDFIEFMGKPVGYAILVLAAIWLLNKTKILPLFIDWVSHKVNNKRASMFVIRTVKNLEVHSVFHELKAWKTRKIKNLNFGDGLRNDIFRNIILTCKITAIEESLTIFLKNNPDLNDMENNKFHSLVTCQVDEIITRYNKEILEMLSEKYGSRKKGKEIFEYVMNLPIKGYNQQHEKVINFLLRIIDDVCTSMAIYNTNVERYWAILNAYAAALTATFVDIEKTYSLYNGDLEKLVAK